MQAPTKPEIKYPSQPPRLKPSNPNSQLASAAPTTPSTMFMSSPILLRMNCSARNPAIAPTIIAAIHPISMSPLRHSNEFSPEQLVKDPHMQHSFAVRRGDDRN